MSKGRIPNQLKKFRKIYGYSQKQVAQKLGMKQSNLVSQWEKGITAPSLDKLFDLAALYHVLVEELYFERYVARKKVIAKREENQKI